MSGNSLRRYALNQVEELFVNKTCCCPLVVVVVVKCNAEPFFSVGYRTKWRGEDLK